MMEPWLNKIKEVFLSLHKGCTDKNNNYAILRGFFYNYKESCIKAIFKIKNSRMTYCSKLQTIIADRDLINQCHPIESFLIGHYANLERNGMVCQKIKEVPELMMDLQECNYPRYDSLLEITSIDFSDNFYIISLKSNNSSKEINIPVSEFVKVPLLLCAIDSLTALSLGYYVAEEEIKLRGESSGISENKKSYSYSST